MMTDTVADMLTRIRNALANRDKAVEVKASRLNTAIADVLKREGYINEYTVLETRPGRTMRVYLKYGPDGEMVITGIRRESRPGRRLYRGHADLDRVLNGLGIFVISTPRGVLSDRECRKQRVGGEILCRVW